MRRSMIWIALSVMMAPGSLLGLQGVSERAGRFVVKVQPPGNSYYDEDAPEKLQNTKYKGTQEKGPKPGKALDRYLEDVLGDYRDRLNFDNQLERLGDGPKGKAFRFVVVGDSRSNWDVWSAIVRHIDSLRPRPAFVINTGDIVYNGYAKQLEEYYIRAVKETDIPYFVTLGNHDDGDGKAREFRYLFGANSLNYYFDYGRARFVFVDSSTDVFDENETFEWLDKTLDATPKGYARFVATHKPPKVIEKWAYHGWATDESKRFTAMMAEHEVDEVFLGHIHAYSTAEYKGVRYSLCGGGGAPLHGRFGPKGAQHGYLLCDLWDDGTMAQRYVSLRDETKK